MNPSPIARRRTRTIARHATPPEAAARGHGGRPRRAAPLIARLRVTVFDAILDAAEEVFSEHGTAHGRMEQIAARAGVSVGTLYNHFENREALIEALLASRRTILLGAVDAALADRTGSFESRLQAFLAAIFSHVASHRRLISIVLQEDTARPPLDSMARAAHQSPTAAALGERAERLMRDGLRTRALARERPEILARAMMGTVRALLADALTSPESETPAHRARLAARLFLKGATRS